MKKLKISILALGCLMALGLTSCLSDDDDNSNSGLTAQQIALCAQAVRGPHSGYLVTAQQTESTATTVKYDSLATTWNFITDSTFTVKIPSEKLAEYVTDTELKEALAAAPDQTLTAYYWFFKESPVSFYVNPMKLDYNLNYGDKDHTVQVYFLYNNSYSFGQYDPTAKAKWYIQLIETYVMVDGSTETSQNKLSASRSFFLID